MPHTEDAYCFRKVLQRCRSEEINRVLESLKDKGFEIQFQSHAAAILEIDFPDAIKELEEALRGLVIPIGEIIGSGGGETKGTQRMRHAFSDVGWHKFVFEIKKIINGIEREAISHEIDHVKKFGGNILALESSRANKFPFVKNNELAWQMACKLQSKLT